MCPSFDCVFEVVSKKWRRGTIRIFAPFWIRSDENLPLRGVFILKGSLTDLTKYSSKSVQGQEDGVDEDFLAVEVDGEDVRIKVTVLVCDGSLKARIKGRCRVTTIIDDRVTTWYSSPDTKVRD